MCVCVWVEGGGVERVTYGLAECACIGAWGAYVGIEEILGIASQCSCPDWEHNAINTWCMCSKWGEQQRGERGEKGGRTYFLCLEKNTQVVQMSK